MAQYSPSRGRLAKAPRKATPRTVQEPSADASSLAIPSYAGDPNFMASLARGLAVIRGFSQQRHQLTIAQLSHRTGIPRAAVRRCLYTLMQLGYVGSEDGRTYSLRPRILALGHAYLSSTPLATAVQPLLDQISSALHESSSLAVLEADEILYIARSSTTARVMSVDLALGSRLPAYCTSMGRVLLAGLSNAEIDAYLSRVKLTRLTSHTVSTAKEFRHVLDVVRREGYAIVDQELEIGLRSIAVPVKDVAGQVVAAINAGTQSARVTLAEMKSRFLPALLSAARELSMVVSR
jgi:IclR family transcriptional regulator, pca regulon regulatory protein